MTDGDEATPKKDCVEMVLYNQGVEKNTYRLGLSQTFFRAGTLTSLDRAMEEKIHGTMVLFQVRDGEVCVHLSLPLSGTYCGDVLQCFRGTRQSL